MKISIAMCTYNGEKYLKEQLDSLEWQTLEPYEVVIVDDASMDGTFKILEDFQKTSFLKVRIFNNPKNLGVVKSFERAISLCEGNYISLCDQDDVWLKEKIFLFAKKMQEAEKKYGSGKPLLIYSDLKIVDKDLNLISPSMFKYYGKKQIEGNPLYLNFIQNLVTGCASMFNRPLKDLALPIRKNAFVHDWWLALVACASGKIIPIEEATILYRQHSKNTIGAKKAHLISQFKKIFQLTQININISKVVAQGMELVILAKEKNLNLENLEKIIKSFDKGGLSACLNAEKNKARPENPINRLRLYQGLISRPYFRK